MKQQRKEKLDKKLTKGVTYEVGKIVFMKRAPEYTGEPQKLQSKFQRMCYQASLTESYS